MTISNAPTDTNARTSLFYIPQAALRDLQEDIAKLENGRIIRTWRGAAYHLTDGDAFELYSVTVTANNALFPLAVGGYKVNPGDAFTVPQRGSTGFWACVTEWSVYVPAGTTDITLNRFPVPGSLWGSTSANGQRDNSLTFELDGTPDAYGIASHRDVTLSANTSGVLLHWRPFLNVMLDSITNPKGEYSATHANTLRMEEQGDTALDVVPPLLTQPHSF